MTQNNKKTPSFPSRAEATAIVIAGGRSQRMGLDKCLLDINGRPLILHVLDQLRPHFAQILVSTNTADGYPPLAAETVADDLPGKGPLMGVLSCMRRAAYSLCFVQACDIPTVDLSLVKEMMDKAADGFDAVVPMGEDGRLEPLFAVYQKSAMPAMERVLSEEGGAMRKVARQCNTHLFPLDGREIPNLNTPEDYGKFTRG